MHLVTFPHRVWSTTVPANVLGCLLVGTVDQQDRVVAWYVAPSEGRSKLNPDGPQGRIHGDAEDQELEEGGSDVGAIRDVWTGLNVQSCSTTVADKCSPSR